MEILDIFSELDGLAVVPAARLFLHEAHDPARLERLKRRLASEGTQANPIIASRIGYSNSRFVSTGDPEGFLVLDGAHRAEALRSLGCRLALVQLVELPIAAQGWQHLVKLGISGPGEIPVRLEEIIGCGVKPLFTLDHKEKARVVAEIETSGGDGFGVIPASEGTTAMAETLWRIQEAYPSGSGEDGVVRRLAPFEKVEPGAGEVVIAYRSFPTAGIIEEISAGRTLPAGVTRFTVPGRILGVGMPLELLTRGDEPEAARWLEDTVARHLRENRIRRYDEPVTLFE
ncbi:MAG: hypothetical protein ACR2KW_12375 [Rubrobacter sp.]